MGRRYSYKQSRSWGGVIECIEIGACSCERFRTTRAKMQARCRVELAGYHGVWRTDEPRLWQALIHYSEEELRQTERRRQFLTSGRCLGRLGVASRTQGDQHGGHASSTTRAAAAMHERARSG